MKLCKCEHWETCPTCYPEGFDEQGNRKPVEIPPTREDLQNRIAELTQDLQTTADALGHANHDLMVRETAKDDEIAMLRRAIERMRVAGGSVEFQMAFDLAKDLL